MIHYLNLNFFFYLENLTKQTQRGKAFEVKGMLSNSGDSHLKDAAGHYFDGG